MFLTSQVYPAVLSQTWGTEPRGGRPQRNAGPAPNEYSLPGGVGPQVLSTKANMPNPAFGRDGRSRTPHQANDLGPAAYSLPSLVGPPGTAGVLSTVRSAPSFTLKERLPESHSPSRDVPGPGSYPTIRILGQSALSTVQSPPSWGMVRPRTSPEGLDDGSLSTVIDRNAAASPSPASYSPNTSLCERSSPSFSLGRRTPSPQRHAGNGPDLGPGSYDITGVMALGARGARAGTSDASPAFSLRGRMADPLESRARRNPSPAPNEYVLPAALGHSPVFASSFAFSVRGRAVERQRPALATPGPNEYVLPSTVGGVQAQSSVLSAPMSSFGIGDRPVERGPVTPGPGAYRVPSTFRSPSPDSPFGITLKGRLTQGSPEQLARLNTSPGPAAFSQSQMDVSKLGNHPSLRTPGTSSSARLSMTRSQREAAEGPKTQLTVVDFNKVRIAAPSFSLRGRVETRFKSASDMGPAAYNLQGTGLKSVQRRNTPAWTLKARWHTDQRGNGVPGPGAYGELALPFLEMKMRAGSRAASPQASPAVSPQASLYEEGALPASRGGQRTKSPGGRYDRVSLGAGIAQLIMG